MANLSFIYFMCNDVAKTKQFYADTLGMEMTAFEEGSFVCIKNNDLELMFFKADYDLPIEKEWAWQPGYKAGSANIMSLSVKIDGKSFGQVVASIDKTGIMKLNDKPEIRRDSYLGVTVKDPMGLTVEVWTPRE